MTTTQQAYNDRLHEEAKERLRALLVLFDQGLSVNEVARQLGVSYQRIQKLKQKALALRLREKENRDGTTDCAGV